MRRLLLLGALTAACATARPVKTVLSGAPEPYAAESGMGERYASALNLRFENDWFVADDGRYTSGLGFSWTTVAVDPTDIEPLAWLPGIGNAERTHFFQFRVEAETYTAEDITDPDPPPGSHPYAGILALDLSVYAKAEGFQHRFTLRVGLVGPSSGAEGLQRAIHKLFGAPIPQGWHTQLSDEPLLNLFYRYNRRLFRRAPKNGWGFDAEASVAAGLGNYYIGANLGLEARVGLRLPDNYSFQKLAGADDSLVGLPAPNPRNRLFAYTFVGLTGYATARFLPTDGNTFTDSPSGNRDDFEFALSTGIVVGWGHLLITWRLFFIRGTDLFSPDNDFGSLTLSYLF